MVEEALRVKVHRKTLEIGKTMVLFLSLVLDDIIYTYTLYRNLAGSGGGNP